MNRLRRATTVIALTCSSPVLACATAGRFEPFDVLSADLVFTGAIKKLQTLRATVHIPPADATDIWGRPVRTQARTFERMDTKISIATDELYAGKRAREIKLMAVGDFPAQGPYIQNRRFLFAAVTPPNRNLDEVNAPRISVNAAEPALPQLVYRHCTGFFMIPIGEPLAMQTRELIMVIRRMQFCIPPHLIFHPERCT